MGEGHTPAPAGGMREVDVPDWLDPSWGSVVTSWTRFSDWLSELEQRGVSPNVASFVGGGTLREHVCGYRRGETTGSERSRMRDLLAQSLSDGALGVAYALIYPPDAYATTDELTEVCQALQRGGIYISHVRWEGEWLLDALAEAIEIARTLGVPAEVYHLKAAGRAHHHLMGAAIDLIDEARRGGVDVTADVYPYAASGTGLSAMLPVSLAEARGLFNRLAEPGVRAQIAAHSPEVDTDCPPEDVHPVGLRAPEHAAYRGRSLAEIAALHGGDWVDAAINLLLGERREIETIYGQRAPRARHSVGLGRLRRLWLESRVGHPARPLPPARLRHVRAGARPLRARRATAADRGSGAEDDQPAGDPRRPH